MNEENRITREMTFSEELPYFKEGIKEVFDNSDNPDGYADMLYLSVLRDSNRIVRKAEEEIARQKTEIEQWKEEANRYQNLWCIATDDIFKAKSEAVKEFAGKMKNKIKTECNPYGKPTFDYDTSISIMHYIDNLVKEITNDKE